MSSYSDYDWGKWSKSEEEDKSGKMTSTDWDKWWKSTSYRSSRYRSSFDYYPRSRGGYGYGYGGSVWEDQIDYESYSAPSYYGVPSKGIPTVKRTSVFTSSSSYYGGYSSSSTLSETQRILMSAYKSARDMITILDLPYTVNIRVANGNADEVTEDFGRLSDMGRISISSGSTKARNIYIPTSYLDNSEYNEEERITLFCGLALHEVSHVRATNMGAYNSFKNALSSYVKKVICFSGVDDTKINPEMSGSRDLILALAQLIEDERVEDLLLSERPGYLDFIVSEKTYQYKTFIEAFNARFRSGLAFQKYLLNLFRLIRYPDDFDNMKWQESYDKIKKLLYPLPTTTKDSCTIAVEIYKIMLDTLNAENMKLGKPKDSAGMDNDLAMMAGIFMKGIRATTSSMDLENFSDINFSKEESSDIKQHGRLLESLMSGLTEAGEKDKVYFAKPQGDRTKYANIAHRISKYIPQIKKIVTNIDKNYDYNIYGCRSGLLDENKLAEAYQGVPQVYIRKGMVRTNKTTICILIDESGSMGGGYPVAKDYLARDAAILLNEALGKLPGIDLYIYGHTADQREFGGNGSTTLYKYREGQKDVSFQNTMSGISAKWENRDGTAIYEAAKRVRKFTDNHCIMIVLSDGAPCAWKYWGRDTILDVRKNVTTLQKQMNFDVIQVCIDTVRDADEMFDNVIDLKSDISTLPQKLGKIITQMIQKDKVTTVTT